ncbi:MAG: N(4)-(beta-N-acetylglucosaminyl)-L-asparaginase [Terriglobia bacterium]
MERRTFVKGVLAGVPLSLASLGRAEAAPRRLGTSSQPASAVAVASANGLEAVRLAYQQLLAGADPVEAAVAGVNLVELDPKDHSVGYSGLPNFDGVVQLDAAVMHGPTAKGGAVAALEGVKTPSKVAKLVMERTDHVLLVGKGARRFATMHGFPNENLLTEEARKIWLTWRERLSDKDDWVEPAVTGGNAQARDFYRRNQELFQTSGTIHLSALTPNGDLGCCTTTSGLAFKIPGRVGDSPLIGAGLYCDNEVGSTGGTGRGEAAILANASHTAVEFMRQGLAPEEALLKTLERVVQLNRDPRLQRPDGRPNFNLRLYGLNKAGAYGSAAIWSGGKFAVADARGARLEEQAYLYHRNRS